jgi:chorismate mutase
MTRVLLFVAVVLAIAVPGIAGAQTATTGLLGLMEERLAIQTSVAQYKWNAKQPIEDREREAALLATVAKLAPAQGLSPDLATDFFRAQIEAGKIVQQALFQRWQGSGQGPFAEAPDLAGTIRPALDRLTPALLAALAVSLPELSGGDAQVRLTDVPEAWRELPEAWRIAVEPLSRAVEP